MVKDINVIGYRVYVAGKDYLFYDTREDAVASAKMFTTVSRKAKVTVVLEVGVWESGEA
jgi:hypothetical protein